MKVALFRTVELLLFPITLVTGLWMKFLSAGKVRRTILAEKVFMALGVYPVQDHYYNPMINPKKHLKKSLHENRKLPGIDMNESGQLEMLSRFHYADELKAFPLKDSKGEQMSFYYDNPSFNSGDAEYFYCMIRVLKPSKVIEIGSGYSTLIALEAFRKNVEEDPNYKYELICVEPYEQPWLEGTGATIVRKKVEDLDQEIFRALAPNDILFIDSSHIIRPQGDVLCEYLEILPILGSGVVAHVHDIFTPKDYLHEWVMEKHVFWNEQYLLEAFLCHNDKWEVLGALNFLAHNHRKALFEKCPVLASQPGREPGSFWLRRK